MLMAWAVETSFSDKGGEQNQGSGSVAGEFTRNRARKSAEFIERWKIAPLFVIFCHPKTLGPFQWVPPEYVKISSIHEVGCAVRSLELIALSHGIGLHGIMGMLVPAISNPTKGVLGIPEDYEIVYFGIMGYPGEEVVVKFPSLSEVCYADTWGRQFQTESNSDRN